jgi:hypothetical protein
MYQSNALSNSNALLGPKKNDVRVLVMGGVGVAIVVVLPNWAGQVQRFNLNGQNSLKTRTNCLRMFYLRMAWVVGWGSM